MTTGTLLTWIATLATAVLAAVCGAFTVGYLANLCVRWYRISGFEGGAGYYVLLLGILGAGAGLVIGTICSRVVVRGVEAHFLKGLGLSIAVVCCLTLIAGLLAFLGADHPPKLEGKDLVLDVQLRTPPGYPKLAKSPEFQPSFAILRGHSNKSGGYGSFDFESSREEAGQWTINGQADLLTSTAGKTVWISLEKGMSLYFRIALPSHPTKANLDWTGWQPVDDIYKDQTWLKTDRQQPFTIRYRVRLDSP